jgi:transcriptional regulator with XRE-family HTH domain
MNSLLILRALKAALKKQKITYKELARSLGVTEAGIKKQFQSSDISFNRINLICDILGISVTALLEEARLKPIRELNLNKVQESHFIKNPKLFIFFLKLSEEKGNADKANVDLQMDSQELWKSLKILDDIGLIKLHPKNRIELIHGSLLTISNKNSAMEKIGNQLAKEYLNRHLNLSDSSKDLKISLLKLSKKNAAQLKNDINKTYEFYLRQSEIDRFSLDPEDISNYSLLLAIGEFSFI